MTAPLAAWGGGPRVSVLVLLILLSAMYLTEQQVVNDGNHIQKQNDHEKTQLIRLTHVTETPKTIDIQNGLILVIVGITAIFIAFTLALGATVILTIPVFLFIYFCWRRKEAIHPPNVSHQAMVQQPQEPQTREAIHQHYVLTQAMVQHPQEPQTRDAIHPHNVSPQPMDQQPQEPQTREAINPTNILALAMDQQPQEPQTGEAIHLHNILPQAMDQRHQEPHTEAIHLPDVLPQGIGVAPETTAQMGAVISELESLLKVIKSPQLKETVRKSYIPRSQLKLGNEIGKGNFGRVLAGMMQSREGEPITVAIKTLRGRLVRSEVMESFLEEGVIMRSFDHPHVLPLLGVSMNEQSNVPLIILPFMAVGDLHKYIRNQDKNFQVQQLLQFGQHVAMGMAYLSTYGFVHRDLAARNCMVDEHLQVKVADFGLSRDIYEKQYYRCQSPNPLPIKWMAPESIDTLCFTTESDVWSFGVLLWELMTRGEMPYQGVNNLSLFHHLTSGHRLRQPETCPDVVNQLMRDCWQENQDRRPIFADLVNRLELIINLPGRNYPNIAVDDPLGGNI